MAHHALKTGQARKVYVGQTWADAEEKGQAFSCLYTTHAVLLKGSATQRRHIAERAVTLVCVAMGDAQREEARRLYPHHTIVFVPHER